MNNRWPLQIGMTVLSQDGEKLGKLVATDDWTFTIEKGLFFPKDYVARYEEIVDVSGDEIRLATTKETFLRMREGGTYGYTATGDPTRTGAEDIRVPVYEEELDVVKRERDAGEVRSKRPVAKEEVRLHKERVTEHRAAEEDLRKERVEIEGEGGAHPVRGDERTPFPPRRDDDLP